ncbi:MAG: ATP-dependent Clp protease ATP-binding subunit [Planctomycetes bacterium]|nr:ATP-dependent Clp protease ATP-binding subunit [Planctomycetota bacterium]
MENLFWISLGIAIGALWVGLRSKSRPDAAWRQRERSARRPDTESPAEAQAEAPSTEDAERMSVQDAMERISTLAKEIREFWHKTNKPEEILEKPQFGEAVETFRAGVPVEERIRRAAGDPLVESMAAESLRTEAPIEDEEPELVRRVLQALENFAPWTQWFALRALGSRMKPADPLLGRLLSTIDGPEWSGISQRFLLECITQRLQAGERPDFVRNLTAIPLGTEDVERLFDQLDEPHRTTMLGELRAWRDAFVDMEYLRQVGKVWTRADTDGVIEHQALGGAVDLVEQAIAQRPQRSSLLVGNAGVGRTSATKAIARKLIDRGFTVFEAGHNELLAGMVYQGQLEGRLSELVERLAGKRVLWVVPGFHLLAWAGRHRYSPSGALDHLLPRIQSGEILVLGLTTPDAYERLVVSMPNCRSALEAVRMRPLDEARTLDVAQRWAEHHAVDDEPRASAATLREAWQLTQQFLQDRAAPGSVLQLLDTARKDQELDDAARPLESVDLIRTLSRLTGLPARILDEGESLDLDAMRRLFTRKVMGQPEAVECLVQRIAMIKAGVTDPTRPLGVFLFAGPTGTGKTEICKAVAEFLFGSAQRMIRIDMSELQSPDALDRLVGVPHEQETKALTDLVREQPFSLILLDEFEKAHARVWDLFLQVFDDGRLTDRRGNVADFRHTIIVMTSNLGAVVPTDTPLGFGGSREFDLGEVERTITRTFRREFLNRIDRVVLFRPLTRQIMRGILDKELSAARERRGLRNRPWAVEWDESAIEFLLDRGFTADLGARPLKRAIEEHVLAPLAQEIVTHQTPAGDQFLFVRSDGSRIAVEFVDPDANFEPEAAPATATTAPVSGAPTLESVALDPNASDVQIRHLRHSLEELRALVEGPDWRAARDVALEATGRPDFWQSPDRFRVLGDLEFRDRVARNLKSTIKLLLRPLPPRLVRKAALRAIMIRRACTALETGDIDDAVLVIESAANGDPDRELVDTLCGMYASWASDRELQCRTLTAERDGRDVHMAWLSISGFGALPSLRNEHGIHMLEVPDRVGFGRDKATVTVFAHTADPNDDDRVDARLRDACARARATPESTRVVRRYRREPSPLVRDAVWGYRSGRLDRVLEGDFDLLGDGTETTSSLAARSE